jgi:uncharacterized repeat protein (TIGR01451 family)
MMKTRYLVLPFALTFGLALILAVFLNSPVQAGGTRYVAPGGLDNGDCSSSAAPCATVQYAVDAADSGDTIKIAAGTYTDIHMRSRNDITTTGVVTQVVYLSKTVAIQGGYATSNWDVPYPLTQSTTLDAQGQGRVLYVVGAISPTLEGLRITHGDASGLGGAGIWDDIHAGGGGYILSATVTLSGCQVLSNTAERGGGLYMVQADVLLNNNIISGNIAQARGNGAGLYGKDSHVTMVDNVIRTNSAEGTGGGVYLWGGATLHRNSVFSNTASDDGGGLYLRLEQGASLTQNIVRANVAGDSHYDTGGGLCIENSDGVTLQGNTIVSNTSTAEGGGLFVSDSTITMTGNSVMSNTAGQDHYAPGIGGGIYIDTWASYGRTTTISENEIAYNAATKECGGLYVENDADNFSAWVSKNTIMHNTADGEGGGVCLGNNNLTFIENTVTFNSASTRGGGAYVSGDITVTKNTFANNAAGTSCGGIGAGTAGGASFDGIISENIISDNTADDGDGGGLCMEEGEGMITGNTITGNTSTNTIFPRSAGGGVFLRDGGTFVGNTITGNRATRGGGIGSSHTRATIHDNIIANNASSTGGGVYLYCPRGATLSHNAIMSNTLGGGVRLSDSSGFWCSAKLVRNRIEANRTTGDGGGVRIAADEIELEGNVIIANDDDEDHGDGVYVYSGDTTWMNNIIADNYGSGVEFVHGSHHMWHTTIAHHADEGVHFHADSGNSLALTNTIIVSNGIGVRSWLMVGDANTTTLEATLWGSGAWANDTDWDYEAASTFITGTHNWWEEPGFLDPDARDYHTSLASSAVDRGVDADTATDLDGEPRPQGKGYDLGADETGLYAVKRAHQNPVQTGMRLTYTLYVTNTSDVAFSATITDTLPAHVTLVSPTHPLVWTSQPLPTPYGSWRSQIAVDIEMGFTGWLTNQVAVRTDTGLPGTATNTVLVAERVLTIGPKQGGTIVVSNGSGSIILPNGGIITTTLEAPPGSASEEVQLVYNTLPTLPHPANARFTGHAFELVAYQHGKPLPDFTFTGPVTITLHYDEASLGGLDENRLTLEYWNEETGEWVDASEWWLPPYTTYIRHPDENWLAVRIHHLSEFVLFGQPGATYLPVLMRNVVH